MSAETVISKRLANGLKPHAIEIQKPMIKAFWNAHAAYKAKLKEERK